MKNIFELTVTNEIISRIESLNPSSKALWGKMNVSQMLAHCCVSYEMVFENKHPKPGVFMRFILKTLVKKIVTSEKEYTKNSRTAPAFLIVDQREFESEKNRLIAFIQKAQSLGESYFDGKESLSFGKLSAQEWNNMFYKHLDHHLKQFSV